MTTSPAVRVDSTSGTNASVCRLRDLRHHSETRSTEAWRIVEGSRLPHISPERLAASRRENVSNHANGDDGGETTLLYLAYGSNLCYETFQGRRGIRPLAQANVVVPGLRMTFDLPGIPYTEPCFANSSLCASSPARAECYKEDYHKDHWHKGMVGVVYEVTPSDYRHIIATEGGGSAYHDILIPCHELIMGDDRVPETPLTEAFNAHTLCAPPAEPGKVGGVFRRPDPSYAQPSPRYLKLISDGAEEHRLPSEYKEYLHSIRAYVAVTQGQRLGRFVFEMLWMPFMILVLELNQKYQDNNGKAPSWVQNLVAMLFVSVWKSYDSFFEPIFGDGERSEISKKSRRATDEEWGEKRGSGSRSI